MKTEPPSDAAIRQNLAAIQKRVSTRISRRRRSLKVGLGTAIIAAVGVGGVSVATAVSTPRYLNFDGFVKTKYAQEFAACIRDAGWDTSVLSDADAAPLLKGAPEFDAAVSSVVRTRVVAESQPLAGHAIEACQHEIGDRVGESILPSP